MNVSELSTTSRSKFFARTRALQAYCLLIGTAALNAAPAIAQDTAPNAAGGDTISAPVSQFDGPTTKTSTSESADIVVTAQRRTQNFKDVPVTVTALTGVGLQRANITTSKDLPSVTPGLTMQNTSFLFQPAIRGVSSVAGLPGSEGVVAIYVDGVYSPYMGGNIFEMADVSRIEVLKGPQGTLFGRNATGGAIQIFTQDPTFTPTGKVYGSYGKFHDVALNGFVSVPIVSDVVALSVSGTHNSTQGWNRNIIRLPDPRASVDPSLQTIPGPGNRAGEIQSNLIRGKLLIKPSESVKLVLTGYYSKRRDEGTIAFSALNGNTIARRFGALPSQIPDEPFEVANDFPLRIRVKDYGFSLKADIDVGMGTITSTSAYQNVYMHLLNDGDYTPLPITQVTTDMPNITKSQELLFTSNWDSALSLVAGAYGYWHRDAYDPPVINVTNGVRLARVETHTKTTSYAGFAEGTYKITDRLSFIAGLRYTYEKRFITINKTTPNPRSDEGSFDAFTPKAAVVYKIDPNNSVYANYTRGFKSGQFDDTTLNLVRPETIDSFELGFKHGSQNVRFTAAAFYYNYKDLQQSYINPITTVGAIENAAQAEIYGAEISAYARISPEFSVDAGAAYTHAKYKDYASASVLVPIVDATGQPTRTGNRTVAMDLSGFRMFRAPRFTGNISATYSKDFDGGALELTGTLYYSSSYSIEPSGRIKQPAYEILNARASWKFGSEGPRIGIYGRNLTNSTVVNSTSINGRGDAISYQERRNYGVFASYDF